MGTRGFVGIVIDGVEHITYNHMSSGPDWLGHDVLAHAKALTEQHSVTVLRDLAANLWSPYPEHDTDPATVPSVAQVMATRPAFAAKVNAILASGSGPRDKTLDAFDEETWRWWLGFEDLTDMLTTGVYDANRHFPLYSGHCEWGYLIDLDRDNGPDRPPGVLEVYRGFQETRPAAGRWAGRPTPAEEAEDYAAHLAWCAENGREPWETPTARYEACAPVAVWALDSLPDEAAMTALYDAYRTGTLTPPTDTTAD